MKQYLKVGIGVILPIGLVAQVLVWIISLTNDFFTSLLGFQPTWYIMLLGCVFAFLTVVILGMIFTHIKLIKRLKNGIEQRIIERVPIVNKIYSFGKEIADTFISDVNEDGDLPIVELEFNNIKMLGILTDATNGIVFIVSSPSPLTGFTIKTKCYNKLDITFQELLKINASLGKIGGSEWR